MLECYKKTWTDRLDQGLTDTARRPRHCDGKLKKSALIMQPSSDCFHSPMAGMT